MKTTLIILFASCILISCKTNNEKNSKIEQTNKQTEEEIKDTFVAKEFLEFNISGYNMEMVSSKRSLFNPFISFDTIILSNVLAYFKKDVTRPQKEFLYKSKDSRLSLSYWQTDEITAEYTELKDTSLIGQIIDDGISFPSKISMGMKRAEFLNLFFRSQKTEIPDSVTTFTVWEDERGEVATKYFFQKDTLGKIQFGYNGL